jgi:hypothetical protein
MNMKRTIEKDALAITEEYDENQGTGVEAENTEGDDQRKTRPYDPKRIRVDPKMFSLRQIMDMIDDGELDLAPDFQRRKVWKQREKSRLIESILLRIPLPAFYFSADSDGTLRVVDGLQRLSTVHDFVRGGADKKGGFELSDLEYLEKELNGKRHADLESSWSRPIGTTQIAVNVIDPQTPRKVKFDIFKRINTGGTPLNGQEIRHCMSEQRSRDFLKACSGGFYDDESTPISFEQYQSSRGKLSKRIYSKAHDAGSEFGDATNWKMYEHVRMADREMILRFCAFRLIADDIGQYGPSMTMEEFLTEATDKIDREVKDAVLVELAEDLKRAMINAKALFGEYAFRKWPEKEENFNPINRALFESWSVMLANYELVQLEPHKKDIVKAARKAMTKNTEFIESISNATGIRSRVVQRFKVVRNILEEFVK